MDTTNDAEIFAHQNSAEPAPPGAVDGPDIEGALESLSDLDPADAPQPSEAIAEQLTRLLHGEHSGDGVAAT